MAGKIVVIGDLMLDKYRYCTTRRNPENIAPCYRVQSKEYKPGGAGNVAASLAKLGSNFKLMGILSTDHYANILEKALADLKVPCEFIRDEQRPTIVKERLYVKGKYECRIDDEEIAPISENHVQEILRGIGNPDLIIVSDYRKGMITPGLMDALRATGIRIVVDAKPEHVDRYHDVFLIKPNAREARDMANTRGDLQAGEALVQRLHSNVLITRGARGISYFGLDGTRHKFPVEKRKEVDVTGAGDIAISTFAHCLVGGRKLEECIFFANRAAGISIEYPGCHPVSPEEIGLT